MSAVESFVNVGGGAKLLDRQIFNADGTWTKPADNAGNVDATGKGRIVRAYVLGAGSGGWGNSTTNGGNAGSGGGLSVGDISISLLGSTVAVTVGVGGAGGTAGGGQGGDGGPSSFGAFVGSGGGFKAANGTGNSSTVGGRGQYPGGTPIDPGTSGSTAFQSTPGGSCGGWGCRSTVSGENGATAAGVFGYAAGGAKGTISATPTAGTAGTNPATYGMGGGGGGGGGATGAGPGGVGGAGGRGAGGGGGGGVASGTGSAGGAGGNGQVVVEVWG
jgi:hypothetical protein